MMGWNVRKQRDQSAAEPGERGGAEIARRRKPERDRQSNAEHRREHRDLQAFRHAVVEQLQLVRRDVGRKHPRQEAPAVIDAVMKRAQVKSRIWAA